MPGTTTRKPQIWHRYYTSVEMASGTALNLWQSEPGMPEQHSFLAGHAQG